MTAIHPLPTPTRAPQQPSAPSASAADSALSSSTERDGSAADPAGRAPSNDTAVDTWLLARCVACVQGGDCVLIRSKRAVWRGLAARRQAGKSVERLGGCSTAAAAAAASAAKLPRVLHITTHRTDLPAKAVTIMASLFLYGLRGLCRIRQGRCSAQSLWCIAGSRRRVLLLHDGWACSHARRLACLYGYYITRPP